MDLRRIERKQNIEEIEAKKRAKRQRGKEAKRPGLLARIMSLRG